MSEVAATTQQTTPAAPADLGGTVEERANALFNTSDPAGEAGSPESPLSNDTGSPAGSEALDPLAKARADRKAKLGELNAKTRAAVDAKNAQREAEQLRVRLAEAEAKTKAYETYVDPTQLTKEQFFDLAKSNPNISPQELGVWLREQAEDPQAAAARAAQTAIDPKLAKLQADLEAANAKIDGFLTKQQTAAEQVAEQQAAHQFASFAQENAATSPLAARFLEQRGLQEFYDLTMGAVEALPPNAGRQALLDEIEDRLTDVGRLYMAAPASPQRPQANIPRTNPAAAQAPTHVTNQLAQQRSRVVDEEAALENMSLEERAAILFA